MLENSDIIEYSKSWNNTSFSLSRQDINWIKELQRKFKELWLWLEMLEGKNGGKCIVLWELLLCLLLITLSSTVEQEKSFMLWIPCLLCLQSGLGHLTLTEDEFKPFCFKSSLLHVFLTQENVSHHPVKSHRPSWDFSYVWSLME